MTQKKKPDFNKILRSILLILGIVFMLLKISARASAADFSVDEKLFFLTTYGGLDNTDYNIISSNIDYYSSVFDNTFCFVSEKSVIMVLYDNLPLYFLTSVYKNNVYLDPDKILSSQLDYYDNKYTIWSSNYIYGLNSKIGTNFYDNIIFILTYNNGFDQACDSISIRLNTGIKSIKSINNTVSYMTANNVDTIYNKGSYSTIWFRPTTFYISNSEDIVKFCPQCKDSYYYNFGSSFGDNLSSACNYVYTLDYDNIFTAYTSIGLSGDKILNILWNKSVYPNTGSYNYQYSIMSLDISVDGQSEIISFSSLDYPDLFISPVNSYIPYKFIQEVSKISVVEPNIAFYLNRITLEQFAYPSSAGASASKSFIASSLYSLNLGADVVEIPAVPSVTPVPISETNIVETEYFNNIVGGTISSSDSFPIASWANTYRVAIADGEILDSNNELNGVYYDDCITNEELESFLGSISSSDPSLNVNSIVNFETYTLPVYLWDGLHYFNYFHKLVYDNIKDFTDIAIYDLYYPSTTLRKRFVIYTDSYYYKLQLQSLGSLQNMIESNTYYVKALYDYSYSRFNGMAESLESMRISNNNLLSSINANILNLQDLVSSGTDRIVNAINGISSGGGGMSVSDLSGALNTLFMPSFEWDQVNYQDYLDSMGVLALPFEFVFDTQSIIKNNYSASLVMPVNDFSVPLGKDFNDNNIEFTVFEDHEDFTFVPTSIFPAALWSVFQYLAAFGLVVGEAWFTYVHIFRKEEKSGDF